MFDFASIMKLDKWLNPAKKIPKPYSGISRSGKKGNKGQYSMAIRKRRAKNAMAKISRRINRIHD